MMKKILFLLGLAALLFIGACESTPKAAPEPESLNLDSNVADLARIVESPEVPVRGFGLVAGLFGTGSSECPPQLREELEKYIWQQLPDAGTINPRRFIESSDTAVVEVLGVIPTLASAGDSFDVVVRPLAGTQTTSLAGGHLYTTDLKELSRFTRFDQYARTIARSQGQIFGVVDAEADATHWYVLGGGYTLSGANISLLLSRPDFIAAGTIRNRINERFGPRTANAISSAEVLLTIPEKYRYDKVRFISMIGQLYLAESSQLQRQRIETLVALLRSTENKLAPEIALEAVGRAATDALVKLLDDEDDAVRFHAARCMSNIGDRRALDTLREFVFDADSPYRGRALRTVGRNARLADAEPIILRALAQEDFQLRRIAYETALAAKSRIISRTLVTGTFFVDRVNCGGPKTLYAKRQGEPRIVIFGAPISCVDDIFFRSDNGDVTINARPGDRFISVARTHPARPRVIGPISSGFEVTQLIRALCESPEPQQGRATVPGLALSYGQVIDILEKMCQQGKIPADFVMGEATEAGAIFGEF